MRKRSSQEAPLFASEAPCSGNGITTYKTKHFQKKNGGKQNGNLGQDQEQGRIWRRRGRTKHKEKILEKLKNNEIDILIGTHSLISENVIYNNLGLVITDEQHRFGVSQRSNLKNKGTTPDILYMSATPIPRTYALTIYGDMDVSNIKTMPNGRKEVKTILKKDTEIKSVLELMYKELKQNHQIYVIAPLIENNEEREMENIYALEEKMNRKMKSWMISSKEKLKK